MMSECCCAMYKRISLYLFNNSMIFITFTLAVVQSACCVGNFIQPSLKLYFTGIIKTFWVRFENTTINYFCRVIYKMLIEYLIRILAVNHELKKSKFQQVLQITWYYRTSLEKVKCYSLTINNLLVLIVICFSVL